MTIYGTDQIAGVKLDLAYSVAVAGQSRGLGVDTIPFALGQKIVATDESVWLFCLVGTGGITGASYVCMIDEAFTARMTPSGAPLSKFGVAACAATAGQYCWIQMFGVAQVQVVDGCAAHVPLYTSTTPGVLTDDDASGYLTGIVSTTEPDGYHADAVHWDGTSYLHNDALDSGEHNTLSFAVWFRANPAVSAVSGFWITDPDADNFSYGEADPDSDTAFGAVQFSLIDVDQETYLAVASSLHGNANQKPHLDQWYAYMGSADCSTNSLSGIIAYLNDIDALNPDRTENAGGMGAVIQGDGVEMRIGVPDPTPRDPLDMANFLMWYGQAIDWSVEANRRFIIDADGKAVDPALAIAEFGTPTVALIGDATAFQTNQGSGGSFALSGSLTNASTSPSD